MACDSVTCITLKHLACNPDLVPSVYRPFAASKGNHGGLTSEEDWEVEETVRLPARVQRGGLMSPGNKRLFPRNGNPLNVVQLSPKCCLLHLNITTPKYMQCELIF